MPNPHYLNTDLDIISTEDLSDFAACIQDDCILITAEQGPDGKWYICAEAHESGDSKAKDHHPHKDLEPLVHLLETLPDPHRRLLVQAEVFEFNIGLESFEDTPTQVLHLSPSLLARIAALGATLGISLYPTPTSSPTSKST